MNPDSNIGFRKVSKKARRGRKGNPSGHRGHRTVGAIKDPITKAFKRDYEQRKARLVDAEHRLELP